jgi:hypothetical protein
LNERFFKVREKKSWEKTVTANYEKGKNHGYKEKVA